MPSILLINENKIVSRLLQLSSQKQGYELEELNNLGASGTSYDVIFVDSDLFNSELLQNVKSKFTYNHLGFIGAKKDTMPKGFDLSIEKPFLPTDFVNLIKEQVIPSVAKQSLEVDDELDLNEETELLLNDDEIDIDMDILNESEELLDMDELEELEDDVDLSLDSSTMMTTGIVDKMSNEDSNHGELAEMVLEIDEMDSVIPLEEVESIEKELENNISLSEVGVATTTIGAVARDLVSDNKEKIDMNDLENLAESQIIEALDEENLVKDESVEEVISEKFDEIETSETTVESNDVESWIRDAVVKAITPQMIKEALEGMDINVTLSFNSKKED